MCRSNSTADRKQHGSSFNSHDSRRFPGKRSNVCYVGDDAEDALRDTNASTDDDDDSYTDEYAYALDGCCSIPVVINGVGADIVTDSGTSCNTINTDIAKQPLKKSARSLTIVPVSYIRMVFHQSRVISSYLHLSRLKVASLFRLIFSLFLVTRPTFGQRDKREARRTFLSNPNPNPKVLQTVIELCNTGRWHEINKYDVDQAALRQFQNVRDELTVNRHGNVLLRNTRIIMPTSLQARAVQLAHEGHQGTSKSKALINSKVWFPGIDTAVDDAVRRCIPCQANTTRQHTEPLNMSNLPRDLWINLSIDFCDPLPSGQQVMVITDEYSRFPIVEVVGCTAAEQVIQVEEKVFCTYGYPDVVKTDNGSPFNSQVWKGFS